MSQQHSSELNRSIYTTEMPILMTIITFQAPQKILQIMVFITDIQSINLFALHLMSAISINQFNLNILRKAKDKFTYI